MDWGRSYMQGIMLLGAALVLVTQNASSRFDPKPWVEDLEVARRALVEKYANLEWAALEREADLDRRFAEARASLRTATSDAEARAIFDRLTRRLGDAHVLFRWPSSTTSHARADNDLCARLDMGTQPQVPSIASFVPGYAPLKSSPSDAFAAGIIQADGQKVGVLRIGSFDFGQAPGLCQEALTALKLPADAPCDVACEDHVGAWAYERMTHDLEARLRALRAAGATTLVVDITRNGGGSEWVEAVARMLTAKRLKPEESGIVRGNHWVSALSRFEADLRKAMVTADPADRPLLAGILDESEAKRREVAIPCDGTPLFRGERPACSWLVKGFHATRAVAAMDPAVLRQKPWARLVFSAMEFPYYQEGVWRGPLIVVVDGGTASAAEEFAAVLQDNEAAVIMGSPSAGAGCGYTNGGTPTALRHSGAVLQVPDCARFRADGTNEVMGIQPDVLVGFRQPDGPHRLSARFADKLPEALRRAKALWRTTNP